MSDCRVVRTTQESQFGAAISTFWCDACGASFSERSRLTRHYRERHGPKVYCCHCGIDYPRTRASDMRDHEMRCSLASYKPRGRIRQHHEQRPPHRDGFRRRRSKSPKTTLSNRSSRPRSRSPRDSSRHQIYSHQHTRSRSPRQYNSSHAPSSRHSASSNTTTIRCQRSPQAMVTNTTDSKTSTSDQIQSATTLCQQLEQPTFNDLPMSPVLPVDLSGDTSLFSTQLSLYDQPQDLFSDGTMNAFTHLSLDNNTSAKSLVSSSNFDTVSSFSEDLNSLISGMPHETVADNSPSSMMLNKALTITVLFDQNNNLLTTAPVDLGNDASLLSNSQLTSLISADGQPLLIQTPVISNNREDNTTAQQELPQNDPGKPLQDLDLLPPPPPEISVGEMPEFADLPPPPPEVSVRELPDFTEPLPPPPEFVNFTEPLPSPLPPPPELPDPSEPLLQTPELPDTAEVLPQLPEENIPIVLKETSPSTSQAPIARLTPTPGPVSPTPISNTHRTGQHSPASPISSGSTNQVTALPPPLLVSSSQHPLIDLIPPPKQFADDVSDDDSQSSCSCSTCLSDCSCSSGENLNADVSTRGFKRPLPISSSITDDTSGPPEPKKPCSDTSTTSTFSRLTAPTSHTAPESPTEDNHYQITYSPSMPPYSPPGQPTLPDYIPSKIQKQGLRPIFPPKQISIPLQPGKDRYSFLSHDPRTLFAGAPSSFAKDPDSRYASMLRRKALQIGCQPGDISYCIDGHTLTKTEEVKTDSFHYKMTTTFSPLPKPTRFSNATTQTKTFIPRCSKDCYGCGRLFTCQEEDTDC